MGIVNSIIPIVIASMIIIAEINSIDDSSSILPFAIPFAILAWGFLTGKGWAPIISLIILLIGAVTSINSALYNPEIKFNFVGLPFLAFFIYCNLICIGHPAYFRHNK